MTWRDIRTPLFKGFRAVYGLVPGSRNPSLHHDERCVTLGGDGGAEPHRRANMSLTIMTASMISRTLVIALRTREDAALRLAGRLADMMGRSSRVRQWPQRLVGTG